MDEGCPPRVVLADDHLAVLIAFGRMLQPYCDVVAKVSTGSDAIEASRRLEPDVLIVDLMLPDVDGLEVCRTVKQSVPDTEVIIVTAFDDPSVRAIAKKQGASAFVPKAWAAARLGPTIQRLGHRKLAASVALPAVSNA